MRPMSYENINASFKKEITLLKHETELKFDSMTLMFQNQLQLILGNQTNFFTQVQNEMKTNDKQTRLVLNTLIEDFAEFKTTLKISTQANVMEDISPLTSGSDQVGRKKGYYCSFFELILI